MFLQHREISSLMFFSSEDELISFLYLQVENSRNSCHHLSGNRAPLSIFVQLFAFSDPGYPDFAKLGGCTPIFDSQTKRESSITHALFEKVQRCCSVGSSSTLQIIFQFAFDMMKSFEEHVSPRDRQADVTAAEQNLTYALCALVNISKSFKWCIESNIFPNPYTAARPCVNCELNSLISILFRKLLPLKKIVPKLHLRGKFGARVSLLISDWWYRIERPSICACGTQNVVGNDELKTVKKIVAPNFLNLPGMTRMHPALQSRLSSIPSSSPEDSPKCTPKVATLCLSQLDIGLAAFAPATPIAGDTPLSALDTSPHETSGVFSRNRVFSSQKNDRTPHTPKTKTFCELMLQRLKGYRHGHRDATSSSE
jgi:hypothetical protein